MMKNDKEKWVNDVLNSMEGSRKAAPRPELFNNILQKVGKSETKIVSMPHWTKVAAVAGLLIMGNVFALQQVNQNKYSDLSNIELEDSNNYQLVSDFLIYE